MMYSERDKLIPTRWRHSSVNLLILAAFLFFVSGVCAQDTIQKTIADVRVIIDVSGSMKQNDPNNLRQPALELLVKLLPENSKAGVWTFGKYINMLVPHREVNAAWRKTALEKGGDINSTGLFTNIGQALEKAAYDVENPNEKFRTSIILLTDGVVDIDREPEVNQREWRRIVDEILPKLKNANYTLHTIALSDNADSDLLNKLAISTDGVAAVANTADDLMKIFLAAFDTAAPAEQVPLSGNSFVVDSSVEEFTALIFTASGSSPTKLMSPEQKEYSFVEEDPYLNWYRSDKYDLITVDKPIEGEWHVAADLDPDSRITVVSNLNMVVRPLRNNLFNQQTQNLSLVLSEDGETITRSNFLDLLDIQYTVDRLSDGQQWRGSLSSGGPPANGIYSTELNYFDTEDDYSLRVFVDGKSFTREFSHTFSVRQPFSVSSTQEIKDGKNQILLSVSYFGNDLDRKNTKMTARVKDPQNRNSVQPLALTASDTWELNFPPETDGTYEFALRVNAINDAGEAFEVIPEPVLVQFPEGSPFNVAPPELDLIAVPDPLPVVEPEPVEEPELMVADDLSTETTVVTEPEPVVEEEGDKLLLYIGLGVGNVLILVLAYFAYRMIMGNRGDPQLEALEKAVDDLDAKDLEGAVADTPAPTMAGLVEAEEDLDSAPAMMSEELDISTEEKAEDLSGDMPAMQQANDEDGKSEDLGVTDVEFSLDDFSSDDIEEEDES